MFAFLLFVSDPDVRTTGASDGSIVDTGPAGCKPVENVEKQAAAGEAVTFAHWQALARDPPSMVFVGHEVTPTGRGDSVTVNSATPAAQYPGFFYGNKCMPASSMLGFGVISDMLAGYRSIKNY